MSDWDFLHDMRHEGYSEEQIAEAAACGYNPWESGPVTADDLVAAFPDADEELAYIFESLVDNAMAYHEITGRHLQIWGELGELYAEIKYGIERHKPHTQGSDGRLGNDFIEIKTISPEKSVDQVQVKRAGNFNKLLVVKISEDFKFQDRIIERKMLSKGDGTHARVSWSDLKSDDE